VDDPKITIYRCSCRACNEQFAGCSQEEANAKHHEHIKTCDGIKALEKLGRFWRKTENILGRKVSYQEIAELLGLPKEKGKGPKPSDT
jgi:hypothetical protein